MVKLFAILAAIAVAGSLLLGGGAWYWWTHHGAEFLDSGEAAMMEGQASGRALDEGGCMTQAIERHKADSYCGNLVSNAVKYCSSIKRAEKLKPGALPGPAFKS